MTSKQATILVVDDEPLNLEIISEYLEDCHYELVNASIVSQINNILPEFE